MVAGRLQLPKLDAKYQTEQNTEAQLLIGIQQDRQGSQGGHDL